MTFKQIADYKKEHAIEFAEWLRTNAQIVPHISFSHWVMDESKELKTTSDLYDIYLTETENETP